MIAEKQICDHICCGPITQNTFMNVYHIKFSESFLSKQVIFECLFSTGSRK